MEQNNEVVVDRAKSQWSDLWKKEDYWAIWIGFFFLIVAAWLCFGQRPALEAKFNEYETIIKAEESKPFKTIEWYKATAAQKNVQAQKQSQVADVIAYLKTPARWTDNPLDALMMDQARADERNAALKPKVEAAKQAAAEALATAKAAQDAAAALQTSYDQVLDYSKMYSMNLPMVQQARLFVNGNYVALLILGQLPDDNTADEAKLAQDEAAKVDAAWQELFGSASNQIVVK